MIAMDYSQTSRDYYLVEKALNYLEDHYQEQPELDDVAASVGFSEYHFQRLFTRWVGISPKRFLQFLTKEHAKRLLEDSGSVLEATYQTGLSSLGRLHDLFVTCEAVTPGQYKSRGEATTIWYGFHDTPFGECLLAITERGICGLNFIPDGDRVSALEKFQRMWVRADLREEARRTAPFVDQIFSATHGSPDEPLRLYLQGTNFQIKVWEALLQIPPGRLVAYEDIANYLGMPTAARAVGRAVAENPVAVLIPCHRVIRKMGAFGGYRWGAARKKALLGWEMARVAA
jgi:AraC family transcriptional regulator of adaptative response/methylated-DNA-[protein]-cysteine methyltransferase